MPSCTAALLASLFILPLSGGPSPDGATRKKSTELFNGKDLTGWKDLLNNASEWQVSKGVLVGRGGGVGQPAVLVTERQDFANYRLLVTFSFPNGTGTQGAVEVRREGQDANTNSLWVSSGVQLPGQTQERPPGNITKLRNYRYGDYLPPARESTTIPVAAERWNTLEIVVAGNHYTTYVNGRQADDYLDTKPGRSTGGIALVCRGRAVMRIKSIQIQEIRE